MKLIKQFGREYGGKNYFKFLTVIPNKLVEKLGWRGGETLKAEVKGKQLIIEKESE